MLSLSCKIAIKAVIYLASKHDSGERAGIREVAELTGSSEHTVGKLLQLLVKRNLINSVKGPSGGFYITKQQLEQPLIRIVEAIDGRDVFNECGLGLSKCSAGHPCPIHEEYGKVRDLFEELCRSRRIIDLCNPVAEGFAYLIG